jgi:hypothetical protein
MKNQRRVILQVTPEQSQRLQELQKAFAQVCNALAPMVRDTRIWNRVALHHMAYKGLREQFPEVGSQMICNAIYSVSRTARAVFQDPASPFNLQKLQGQPLPLLRFADTSPVYFDRHTLSLRGDQLSLYTLSGRMRFRIGGGALAAGFHERKLLEVLLSRRASGEFELAFRFAEGDETEAPARVKMRTRQPVPEYVQLEKGA